MLYFPRYFLNKYYFYNGLSYGLVTALLIIFSRSKSRKRYPTDKSLSGEYVLTKRTLSTEQRIIQWMPNDLDPSSFFLSCTSCKGICNLVSLNCFYQISSPLICFFSPVVIISYQAAYFILFLSYIRAPIWFYVLSKTEEQVSHLNPESLLAKIACVVLAAFAIISVSHFDKRLAAGFGPQLLPHYLNQTWYWVCYPCPRKTVVETMRN